MGYKIREIKDIDYPDLIELFKEFAIFERSPDRVTNSVEQMELEKDLLNGFVAIDESQQIIGYITCFFTYYTWFGKSMYIDDLFVKIKHRGRGLGTKLLNQAIKKAKEENCKKLRWQVSRWNKPAIDFYENLGATVNDVQLNCDLILENYNGINF